MTKHHRLKLNFFCMVGGHLPSIHQVFINHLLMCLYDCIRILACNSFGSKEDNERLHDFCGIEIFENQVPYQGSPKAKGQVDYYGTI